MFSEMTMGKEIEENRLQLILCLIQFLLPLPSRENWENSARTDGENSLSAVHPWSSTVWCL